MKRPLLITIVCVILAIALAANVVTIVSIASVTSAPRLAWMILTTAVAGVSVVGLWRMNQWGPALYLAGQAVGVAAWLMFPVDGAENAYPIWLLLIIPAIYAACVLPFWRQMKPLTVARS